MKKDMSIFPVVADNIFGMATTLNLAKGTDDYDLAIHVLVDLHINVTDGSRLIGCPTDEFSRLIQARRRQILDQRGANHVVRNGVILPKHQGYEK